MNVSAIIPTYNRIAYIRRAIDSVLAQTVPPDEVIVVDDGSTDGTAEAVAKWYGNQVRLIRQQNTGVSGARRHGVLMAQGEWIAFLDSDDEWLPEHNEQLLRAAELVPADVAWIFGDLRVVNDGGEGSSIFEDYGLAITESPHVFPDSLTVQFPFQFGMVPGSLVRRSALLKLGCFTQDLRSSEDLLAGFQVACHYRCAAIPAVVGRYFRTSDLSATSLVRNGTFGRDYYRSRMLCFAEVIESGRGFKPWNQFYASEVRDYCKVLAHNERVPFRLAMQQFRYGAFSLKSIAFSCAAIFGNTGIRAWSGAAAIRRKLFFRNPAAMSPKRDVYRPHAQKTKDSSSLTVAGFLV